VSQVRLQYVQTFNARGRRYSYFRKPGSARIRLGLPGSTELMSAYQAALDAAPRIEVGATLTVPDTLSALVVAYYTSADFQDLGSTTQQIRRYLIERLRGDFGKYPVKLLEAKHINAMLTRITKPHMRKQWLKMLRGLMAYAVRIGMRIDDPTADFKIKQRQSDGIVTWGESEIEAFRNHHPLGSRARLALELLLDTVQRRGDVVRMGRQHIRGDLIHVTQQKTGAKLRLPLLPELMAGGNRRDPERSPDVLDDCQGQTLHRRRLWSLVSPPMRRGGSARLQRTWAAQGRLSATCRSRMHGEADRRVVGAPQPRGDRALYQGRRRRGVGAGGDGQDANVGCQTRGAGLSNNRATHWRERKIKWTSFPHIGKRC
jgi:integrase